MIKINLFFGSIRSLKSHHDLNDSYLGISEIVYTEKLSNEEYNDYIERINADSFVALTEDYSQLSDTGLRTLHAHVLKLMAKAKITLAILQNPPKILVNNFKNLEKQFDFLEVEITHSHHKQITKDNLLEMNSLLNNQIIGQHKAKREVLTSLYGLCRQNNNKPIVLMLYGPSGVGKTETAKIISDVLGGKLLRLQMSMFQNHYYLNYLFGEKHNMRSFAVDLLERESNIILLDEFDKAPTNIHYAFYRLFDENIFDDSNYEVILNNTIFICTSNYQTKEQIKKHIGEPLYYRFNNIIEYEPLSLEQITKVIYNIFEKKINELDSQDQKIINNERNLKELFINYFSSSNNKNFREVENTIEKLINHILLSNLLED